MNYKTLWLLFISEIETIHHQYDLHFREWFTNQCNPYSHHPGTMWSLQGISKFFALLLVT